MTAAAAAIAIGLAVAARHARWTAGLVVVLMLITVFLKGTSPGGPRQREEFQASKNRDGQ